MSHVKKILTNWHVVSHSSEFWVYSCLVLNKHRENMPTTTCSFLFSVCPSPPWNPMPSYDPVSLLIEFLPLKTIWYWFQLHCFNLMSYPMWKKIKPSRFITDSFKWFLGVTPWFERLNIYVKLAQTQLMTISANEKQRKDFIFQTLSPLLLFLSSLLSISHVTVDKSGSFVHQTPKYVQQKHSYVRITIMWLENEQNLEVYHAM